MMSSKMKKKSVKILTLFVFISLGVMFLTAQSKPFTEGDAILREATALIGSPYKYNSTGRGGYDCSGLVYSLYSKRISNFPRTSGSMGVYVDRLSLKDTEAGDLIFFTTGSNPSKITHVGILDGQGNMVHSASDGKETGVIKTSLEQKYWKDRILFAGRVPE